nr:MAG TPA: hypothetical protein [Caudoviricetes sp.]
MLLWTLVQLFYQYYLIFDSFELIYIHQMINQMMKASCNFLNHL